MTTPTSAPSPSATGSVQIAATPEAVYALITDLPVLAELAEENVRMRWRKGSAAQPGAVFVGHNRNGWRRWSTTCTVTDARPGETFAFDVRSGPIPVAHWAYQISPDSEGRGGCGVTESTWDRRPRWVLGLTSLTTGVSDRAATNAEHIRVTLDRLKRRAEQSV